MLVQKKISVQGQWAKVKEDIFNGDIIKILDGGKIVEGEYGERHIFKVLTEKGERILSFNQTTMNYLIDAFGAETDKWVDKEVKVWLIKSNVSGKMRDVVYLTDTDWIESDDGFCPPNKKKAINPEMADDEIPIIEE